jgi:hypothetical protein
MAILRLEKDMIFLRCIDFKELEVCSIACGETEFSWPSDSILLDLCNCLQSNSLYCPSIIDTLVQDIK